MSLDERIDDLKSKHQALETAIEDENSRPFDQLEIQRLKKRKLALKDEILQIENRLLPDIIA